MTIRSVARFSLLICAIFIVACPSTREAPPSDDADVGVDADTGADDVGEEDVEGEVDTGPPLPPEIDISPSNITYSGVEIDETESTRITVRNLGEQELTVQGVDLEIFDHPEEHDLEPGDDVPEFPHTLLPNTFDEFHVEYTPRQAGSTSGEVVIQSDDPETSEVTIRIETISAYPEIDAPDQISFGNLDPDEDESETERIEVYNRGLEPLEISAVDVAGDDPDDFSVEIVGTDELPASLERHDFYYLDVTFAPGGDGGIEDTRRGEIVVESDDPLSGEHVIELSGNRPHPCLQTGGDIDFGEMSDGQSSTDTVALFNCSFTRDLEVTDVEIEDDADGVFELVDEIDDPLELIPQEVFEIEVEATMNTNQEVVGLLTLSSDDPEADYVEIELRAQPADD